MGEKKVTIMVLKVDLQCEKCFEKVKKVLCKFPQIRDQMYDEKNNQVIIKVVCCSPEKIRDKLCCKGGGAIKSIEIVPEKPKLTAPEKKQEEKPEKKPEPEKKQEEKPEKEPEPEKKQEDKPEKKPQPDEKKPEKLNPAAPPFPAYPPVTVNVCCIVCYGGHPGCPCQTGYGHGGAEKPKEKPEAENPKPRPPVIADPPVSACCMECYEGHPGGPCQTGYGYGGPAPSIQYDGYCGRTVYDSYGGGRSYATSSSCVTRPDCFSEENPQACAIM